MTRILVIAPNSELRQSLQFALESEGYEVTPAADLDETAAPDAAVTVVDHHALGKNQDAAVAFLNTHKPVVLLANAKAHQLSHAVFDTVMKPMLGARLSAAIRQAIEARNGTT